VLLLWLHNSFKGFLSHYLVPPTPPRIINYCVWSPPEGWLFALRPARHLAIFSRTCLSSCVWWPILVHRSLHYTDCTAGAEATALIDWLYGCFLLERVRTEGPAFRGLFQGSRGMLHAVMEVSGQSLGVCLADAICNFFYSAISRSPGGPPCN
jgi:hypothetical protein